MKPSVVCHDRNAWRAWLAANHGKAGETWLVFYKKHTGRNTVSYRESVEEALCFGWIDGLKRRIDEERYAYRFTPRRRGSKWSPLNIRLAEKMIAQGKMKPAGLAAYEQRRSYDENMLRARESKEIQLTPELESALKQNRAAWDNFRKLAPGYRKQYAGWLMSAKRVETREKRLAEALVLLENNQKLGMK